MKLLLIFSFLLLPLFGAPAFNGQRTFTQPDGSVVTYRLQGDEHLHWMESDDGQIILYNEKSHRIEHAEIKDGMLKPSGVNYQKESSLKNKGAAKSMNHHIDKKAVEELYRQKRALHYQKMHPNR